MQNLKKLLALLLVVVMVAALFVGCKPAEENKTTTACDRHSRHRAPR